MRILLKTGCTFASYMDVANARCATLDVILERLAIWRALMTTAALLTGTHGTPVTLRLFTPGLTAYACVPDGIDEETLDTVGWMHVPLALTIDDEALRLNRCDVCVTGDRLTFIFEVCPATFEEYTHTLYADDLDALALRCTEAA